MGERSEAKPFDRRSSTVLWWPSAAASIRAVRPSLSLALISAPCFSNDSATWDRNAVIAKRCWRGHLSDPFTGVSPDYIEMTSTEWLRPACVHVWWRQAAEPSLSGWLSPGSARAPGGAHTPPSSPFPMRRSVLTKGWRRDRTEKIYNMHCTFVALCQFV